MATVLVTLALSHEWEREVPAPRASTSFFIYVTGGRRPMIKLAAATIRKTTKST